MKKFVLLASLMALAALMLAAAPAFAQAPEEPPFREIDGALIKPGDCGGFPGEDRVPREEVLDRFDLTEEELNEIVGGVGTPFFCLIDDDGRDDGNGRDDGRDDDNGRDDRDRFNIRDVGNVEVAPVFEITQETEQECESGEVDQSVNVTGGGDNSIQTVGAQPTVNTGCAQNATGIVDVDPVVAGFGGDTIFNVDDNNGDDNNGDDGRFIRCDLDGDGHDDGVECEDFDDGLVFCDRDGDGHDDGDDECFVFVNDDDDNGDNGDRDVFRIGGDRFDIDGAEGDEFEVDSNASIDVSPHQTVDGGGTINQTAIAVSVDDDHHKKWWDHHKGWA